MGVFASVVRHDSWLFYQGGDQITYYATSSALVDLGIAPAGIGYGWSYLLTPFAAVSGANLLDALPAILLCQIVLLLPVALLCVYGIGARIGGRAIGYFAATAWVFVPFLAIPLFVERYHSKYVEQFLPQTLGLTALADFPSTVVLLVSAYFCVRAVETRALSPALVAGATAGFAAGLKPSNMIFLPAPVVALALVRNARLVGAFVVAAAPALITLALWKHQTLGEIPVFSLGGERLAAGPGPLAASRYLDIDWAQLERNAAEIREFFWSVRVLEFLPLAGIVAVARRSRPLAALLGIWCLAFVLIKGSSAEASVGSGSFFRLLMPAFPAFLLLGCSLPILVPGLGQRLLARVPPLVERRYPVGVTVAAGLVGIVIPIVLVVGLPAADRGTVVVDRQANLIRPVSGALAPAARREGKAVSLTWRRQADTANVFYWVVRLPADADCWVGCDVEGATVAKTTALGYVDRPPPGKWSYRIGEAANWLADPAFGDVYVLSPAIDVNVR